MKKLLVKSLVFSILAIASIYGLGHYFNNLNTPAAQAFRGLYLAEKNSIDIIFLGNSHMLKGIDTEIIDAKCNTTSLNISVSESNIVEMYNNLKEVLAYQKPKLVVLECWPLIGDRNSYNNPIENHFQTAYSQYNKVYYKRLGRVNIKEFITNSNPLKNNLGLINNRNNWKETEAWRELSKYRDSVNPKKYLQKNLKLMWSYDSTHINKFDTIKNTFSAKNMHISSKEKEYLTKVFELSEVHGFNVLLLTVPVYKSYYNEVKKGFKKTQSQLDKITKGYSRVSVLDLNKKLNGLDYTHILKEKHITDNQHLNYKGIVLTSNKTANYINYNYSYKSSNNSELNTVEKLLYNEQWQKFLSNSPIEVIKFQFKKVTQKERNLTTKSNNTNIRIEIKLPEKNRNINFRIAFRKSSNFIYISNNLKKSGTNISLQKAQLIKGIYDLILIEENLNSGKLLLHPIKQQLVIQ